MFRTISENCSSEVIRKSCIAGIFVTYDRKMAADLQTSPDLSYEMLRSPKWRDEDEPATHDMLRQTVEFILTTGACQNQLLPK